MKKSDCDEIYMRRCIQLARCGTYGAPPNPVVGAVLVADGRIIGEGYHARCGSGHAEVNAFASVRASDEPLIGSATLYVSLEPCSHYGRTPPCADMIVRRGAPRVVVGCVDPSAKVNGSGIARLRSAGVDVTVGVCESDCLWLIRRFVVQQVEHRPYTILKWAQSADGYIDRHGSSVMLSTAATRVLVHRLRAQCGAIVVGRTTLFRDRPLLDVRYWAGRNPLRAVLSRSATAIEGVDIQATSVQQMLSTLQRMQVQMVLVEGGAATHRAFVDAAAWDELRVETAPVELGGGTAAMVLPPDAVPIGAQTVDGNTIRRYARRSLLRLCKRHIIA